jgi:hypothetical protein
LRGRSYLWLVRGPGKGNFGLVREQHCSL